MNIIVLLLLLYNKSNSPKYFDERQLLLLLAILFISTSNLRYLNTYGLIKHKHHISSDDYSSYNLLTSSNDKQTDSMKNKKTYDDKIKKKDDYDNENKENNNIYRFKNIEKGRNEHNLKEKKSDYKFNEASEYELDKDNNVKTINKDNDIKLINNNDYTNRESLKGADEYVVKNYEEKNDTLNKHRNLIVTNKLDMGDKKNSFGNIKPESNKELVDDLDLKKVNKDILINNEELKKIDKNTTNIEHKNNIFSSSDKNNSEKLKYDFNSNNTNNNTHDKEKRDITKDNISMIKSRSVISQIIKEKYSGMTVSIILRGIGMVTGKVVFNFEGVTALQLKNNTIIYINNNIITDIF